MTLNLNLACQQNMLPTTKLNHHTIFATKSDKNVYKELKVGMSDVDFFVVKKNIFRFAKTFSLVNCIPKCNNDAFYKI